MTSSSKHQPSAFSDLQSGLAFLTQLPLANPVAAEMQLMAFLDVLLANPPEPGILLRFLEQARPSLAFVEEEMAKRYCNHALPLTDDEDRAFQQVVSAWRKMGKAYALCARLQEPNQGDGKYHVLVATILHRCLYYQGMVVFEHYRARRELPDGLWLDLHGYYETAEEWGVAYTPVDDILENTLQATHCTAAYATILLIDMASPYSYGVRDMSLIRRWAGIWAPLISIHHLEEAFEVPSYLVQLMKDLPLHPPSVADEPGPDARRLDTARLGLQIDHMLAQLRQRITPTQLGLGEIVSSHAISLLGRLSRPWAQLASPRRFRRFSATGTARIAAGFEAMYFLVAGEEFTQSDSATAYSRGEFDQIFTFRDQVDPGSPLATKQSVHYLVDQWEVINHSAAGFRLGRSAAGQRISHSQLIVVCPHDGERFLLAQVCWLMQEHAGGLIAGVATLPGMPAGIGVRPVFSEQTSVDRFVRAFILPAVPAIHEEGSLVIPTGIYQASRVLEASLPEGIVRIRMNHMLQRGVDFDRVSYEIV